MTGNNRIVAGRYRGELLDDESRHSIQLRDADSTFSNTDRLIVDYFYHAGQFWTAVLPLGGIAEIYGQSFNFSKPKIKRTNNGPQPVYDSLGVPKRRLPVLNHVQTRFRLKPGYAIELHDLHGDVDGPPAHSIDDIVYSLEAVGPFGVNFGIRDAIGGNLISAHRFVSTEEMVFERIVVEGQYVMESPPIPLNDQQKQDLLWAAVQRSHRAGMHERYYMYRCCATNNCTSNPLQMLDDHVKYRWRQRWGSKLFRLPMNPRLYLRVRGMDADPTFRKNLRDEFADFIQDPSTQQRKRDYVRKRVRRLREARKHRKAE